ncbi:unnamed protein product [Linum trigynum]|uniref:Uncharacterized protein n=1 Tax=Linum trigynum TaxID=586398 RepID=A0AAV2DBD2_9ROSI
MIFFSDEGVVIAVQFQYGDDHVRLGVDLVPFSRLKLPSGHRQRFRNCFPHRVGRFRQNCISLILIPPVNNVSAHAGLLQRFLQKFASPTRFHP